MFLVSLLIVPENSTTVYIQELVKIMDVFDKTACQQVKGFFQPHQQNLADIGSGEVPEPPALVHKKTDALLISLIDKKRMARREISFNAISPVDVNELTKIVKKLRVPLHAIAIAHTMDSNMRKMELLQRADDLLSHKYQQSPPKESNTGSSPTLTFAVPPSDLLTTQPSDDNHQNDSARHLQSDRVLLEQVANSYGDLEFLSATAPANTPPNRASILLNRQANLDGSSKYSSSTTADGDDDQQPHEKGQTIRSVSLDKSAFEFSLRRQVYNKVLQQSQHMYIDLMKACSTAVAEDIKRLRHMQSIDARYQDKPFFYKYLFGSTKNDDDEKYDHGKDPAAPLLLAIQHFDAHRLHGLKALYNKDQHPRRSLLLILKFQFSLRKYAEILYTFSSLVYEMDRVRHRRRFWLPSVTIWKFFWKRRESSYDLDSPSGLANQAGNSNMHRTMTQHTALIQSMIENDAIPQQQQPQSFPSNDQGGDDISIELDDSDDEPYSDSCTPNALPSHPPRHAYANNNYYVLSRQLSQPVRGQVLCPQDTNNNNTWFHQHDRPERTHLGLRRRQRQQKDEDQEQQADTPLFRKLAAWRKHIGQQNKTGVSSVTPSALLDPSSYHDPDASYPTTRLQRFFYCLWGFGTEYIYTSDTVFALRAAIVVTLLTLPGFLNQSLGWYNEARCQWATVVALIWMGPSVGSSLFG